MRIDEELGMKIDLAAPSAELACTFHALAAAATARPAAITGKAKEVAFERGRMFGVAKAFRACARVDELPASDELELVIG